MRFEIAIARRFLFPNREKENKPTFISVVATGGIALGTAALILTLSIVQGFSEEIKNKIIGFGAHIHLIKVGGEFIKQDSVIAIKTTQNPNVASASPFLQKDVILKTANGASRIEPALLKAIEPQTDNSFIRRKITSGTYFGDSVNAALPLILGKKLAQKLALKTGDKLLVIATTKDFAAEGFNAERNVKDALKAMRIETATLVGVYETGLSQGFDDAIAFTTLKAAQNFLSMPEMISGYEIAVKDIERVGQTAAELDRDIGFPIYARTIYQLYQSIFVWLRFQENIIPLLLVSVTIVAAFNVISTLLIIVLEKEREIGVIMSFGASAKQVKTIFVSQALLMALAGIAIGNALAFGLSVAEKSLRLVSLSEETYFISNVAIAIKPANYVVVSGFATLTCWLASLAPSGVAARLHPVKALRK
ncbi:MAG: ABC transporter permease [Chloroherpetonaceae bacterium]|nr:ABC transporter permease [Chloroherpetonaceae bacterium]MDW8437535.1 FtsX-like permease family protein [Chloroherpetonaceae bacterium]